MAKPPMTQIDKDRFGPWAIVTGASSGIGKEFARQLAASGLGVVIVARRLAELEEVGRGLERDFAFPYRAVQADLTEPDFLEAVEAATRGLDIGLLVSNAGAGLPGEFLSHAHESLLRIVRLNVAAHLGLVHHFGRRLAERGRGGVVLVSAAGAFQGLPYMANDSATKAYMLNLREALHDEFRKRGLHMTVLLPGPTDTPMLAALGFDPATSPTRPMSAAQCVAEGLAALQANRATHVPGRLNRLLAALLPRALGTKLMGRMIGKWVAGRASAPALAERL